MLVIGIRVAAVTSVSKKRN